MQVDGESTTPDQDPKPDFDAASPRSLRNGLYILPALIVLVFVIGWLFVFWMLHEDQDPQSLIQGMQEPGRRSWQNAYALSQLLLDPENDHLKDDKVLCRALVVTLQRQNEQARVGREAGGPEDRELAQFRIFLCRSLGEFRLLDGLPTLLGTVTVAGSTPDTSGSEREVQRAALEAIAVLATNVGPEALQTDESVIEVLVQACRPSGGAGKDRRGTDVASAATFALGVIGGPQATEHLLRLIGDTRLDVRYNAATGLARYGRAEAIPVVLEMLDADNRSSLQFEKNDSAKALKQSMVIGNGIEAAVRLLPSASPAERRDLINSLRALGDSSTVPARVRIDARQALLKADAR